MKKLATLITMIILAVGVFFAPLPVKAEVLGSINTADTDNKVVTVKIIAILPHSMSLELDRPIKDQEASWGISIGMPRIDNTPGMGGMGMGYGKRISEREKLIREIEAIPGIKAADASGSRILVIFNAGNSFTCLTGEILLAIAKHFKVDSIKIDIDK